MKECEVYSSFDLERAGLVGAADWLDWRSQKYPRVRRDQMDMERKKYQIPKSRGRRSLAGASCE